MKFALLLSRQHAACRQCRLGKLGIAATDKQVDVQNGMPMHIAQCTKRGMQAQTEHQIDALNEVIFANSR